MNIFDSSSTSTTFCLTGWVKVKAVAKAGARVKVKAENGREAFVEAVTVDQNVSCKYYIEMIS